MAEGHTSPAAKPRGRPCSRDRSWGARGRDLLTCTFPGSWRALPCPSCGSWPRQSALGLCFLNPRRGWTVTVPWSRHQGARREASTSGHLCVRDHAQCMGPLDEGGTRLCIAEKPLSTRAPSGTLGECQHPRFTDGAGDREQGDWPISLRQAG